MCKVLLCFCKYLLARLHFLPNKSIRTSSHGEMVCLSDKNGKKTLI
jgi:hypothetical protein